MNDTLRNTPADFARRLYALLPENYRAYDAEEDAPAPLEALLTVIGEQVSNIRLDLDSLWDDFFIETCDDWVVPYLASLVGTQLLPRADERSIRLDVRNTVAWRRRKGTPAVLREVAAAMSGWPTDRIAEFFASLGWSQNVNHLRLGHPLTVDVRDPYRLDQLGHAIDPFAHAADFRKGSALDGARVVPGSLGIGVGAWGTPGRYQIKQLGAFVHRLQTFRLTGVDPAAADPGLPASAQASCFTFDPLHREAPLFVEATGEAISRDAFDHAPWSFIGEEIGVRQFGVQMMSDAEPLDAQTGSSSPLSWDLAAAPQAKFLNPRAPFTFGGQAAGMSLNASAGLRLMNVHDFEETSAHFVISAEWWNDTTSTATLMGSLSTKTGAFVTGAASTGAGQLRVVVRTGRSGLGFAGLPASNSGRFPGAIVAIRRANTVIPRVNDVRYLALPASFISTTDAIIWFVADDGSTYSTANLAATTLERSRFGDVYPARSLTASRRPASDFSPIGRGPNGLRLPDSARLGTAQLLVQAEIFAAGPPQILGAIASVNRVITSHPGLEGPNNWPAFTYRRGLAVLAGNVPEGKLAIRVVPLSGVLVPQCEVIIQSRAGETLLVYIPEIDHVPATGHVLLVGDDGSTWNAPTDPVELLRIVGAPSLDGLILARASAGQVLPIAGRMPLQHRVGVGLDLCSCDRRDLLKSGELGVDPERGRFAFAPGDPAEGSLDLSVDYVEAFGERVGARTFVGRVDISIKPTRLVAKKGDAVSTLNSTIALDHIHTTVADALAKADPNDVIEIVDSATYLTATKLTIKPGLMSLTLRAAEDQRPCISTYTTAGNALAIGLQLSDPMARLELSGLLMSGGTLRIDGALDDLNLTGCTLDPLTAGTTGSLVSNDADGQRSASYLLCRCITGDIRLATGVGRITIADSVLDAPGKQAITSIVADQPVRVVQLERVTMLGQLHCVELHASETILDELASVEDRQIGCIRYSRYERDSILPRKFACVPSGDALHACPLNLRCVAPIFDSRHFSRPDYAFLAQSSPVEIAHASEAGSEIGAFASGRSAIRLENLELKLREFLPVGLSALALAET